ncbi:MAG TPA: DUF2784 domain-containing protein, partial [Acidobacteria bacterium]|nr:DUF2784 domain-containing protein [Acidobacteriota bacterium]
MCYLLAADAIALLHMAFVLFVGIGVVAVWRWWRLVWLHVPAVVWGITVELTGEVCPLTPLEQWLLRQGGQMDYQGAFLTNYLSPLLYPTGLTVDSGTVTVQPGGGTLTIVPGKLLTANDS